MSREARSPKRPRRAQSPRRVTDVGADRLIAASYQRLQRSEALRRVADRTIARLTARIFAERQNLLRLLGQSELDAQRGAAPGGAS